MGGGGGKRAVCGGLGGKGKGAAGRPCRAAGIRAGGQGSNTYVTAQVRAPHTYPGVTQNLTCDCCLPGAAQAKLQKAQQQREYAKAFHADVLKKLAAEEVAQQVGGLSRWVMVLAILCWSKMVWDIRSGPKRDW
jgi:hypothetical protein